MNKTFERLDPSCSRLRYECYYPFFVFHILMFGVVGFFKAYSGDAIPVHYLYMEGGTAITIYVAFYLYIFGLDEVKWMFINAGLGLLGISSQINWLLSLFGKKVSDYPLQVHVIPFLYYILYTFLIRQIVLDITRARDNETTKRKVEYGYVAFSTLIYLGSYLLERL